MVIDFNYSSIRDYDQNSNLSSKMWIFRATEQSHYPTRDIYSNNIHLQHDIRQM